MKLLFDNTIFFHQKVGGISRNVINVNNFLKKKINSKIFSGVHINEYLNQENKIFYIKKIPRYSRRSLQFLNKLFFFFVVKTFKPNIIHRTFYTPNFLLNKKIKSVITIYDLIHETYPEYYTKKKSFRPKSKIFQNTDLILCPSKKTKEDLIYFYNLPEEKIKISYIPVNNFNKKKLQKRIINDDYILYVGDRKKYKNFKNFIISLSLKNLTRDFKIVFFGGNAFDNDEIEIIKKNNLNLKNIIQLSGNDLILKNLYQYSTLFVYPSKYEGFGLPPLEAMSQGCPVSCSNHPAIIEGVGDAADCFDANNPDFISHSINKVLNDSEYRKILIKKGFKRVGLFDSEKHYTHLLDIYKGLL